MAPVDWARRDRDLRAAGWHPIRTAPIAVLDVVIRAVGGSIFASGPNTIVGMTSHNRIVRARYDADGSYLDRWTNERGNVFYTLTHWRPFKGSEPL